MMEHFQEEYIYNYVRSSSYPLKICVKVLKYFYVYILSSGRYGALYIGVTNNLFRRICEHKKSSIPGFSKKYRASKLVYYEIFYDSYHAILREKRLKKWNRSWKIKLIEKDNPNWIDLFDKLE